MLGCTEPSLVKLSQAGLYWAGENFTWVGAGPLDPPQIQGGGVAERGSKGHKLICSMQISENFGSNLLMRGGGVQGCKNVG